LQKAEKTGGIVRSGGRIRQLISQTAYLWLAGVLFLLVIAGYVLYAVLLAARYVQTRKRLLSVVLAAAAFLAGVSYYCFMPLWGHHERVVMVVPRGHTVRRIADTLYKQEVIASRGALVAWLKISGIERRVEAGKFSFMTRGGVIAAARALTMPVPLDRSVTVPEGLTIEQTAAHIGKAFAVDTAEFARLCRDTAFLRKLGLAAGPSVEGYLFPDTYSFHETATPAEMIKRMVGRFNEEWARLDTAAMAARGLNKKDIVIIASIVEKEALISTELPRIAGVFYNRLRLGVPLGADPTVRYIFKKWSGPLYVSELKSRSPYNTRLHKGLPPGPICSPGRASLAASVSPAQTNELYFVARWDGSGGHEFSATHDDHVRKKNAIRKINEQRLHEKEK
jgi:UPF0755 protein